MRFGALLRVDAAVRRDLSRDCSVQFSRHILDAAGVRWNVQELTGMSAEALRQLGLPYSVPETPALMRSYSALSA